ncbi:hypothetical protein [Lysobacter antibioticus]|uniref:hypothetical protein n=1 Tax=Lysobacter antibioticus TaxID=84531 RepID=UPI0011DF7C1A|nr:hypothetical protein [Lysobacter antibioticus]
MNLVLDASTFLNLINGEVLLKVLKLRGFCFFISKEVRRESKSAAEIISELDGCGFFSEIDDAIIDVALFEARVSLWNLGAGEAESIIAAELLGHSVACDDLAGRRVAAAQLGAQRVTGSVGLLRRAVEQELIAEAEAWEAYRLMRERGGFLPDLAADYFSIQFQV